MPKKPTRRTIYDAVTATKEVPYRPSMAHAPTRQDLIEKAEERALGDELAADHEEIDQLSAEYLRELDRAVLSESLRLKLQAWRKINRELD